LNFSSEFYWKRSQELDLGLQSATEEKANLESALKNLNIEKCAAESDRDKHEAAGQELERSLNSEKEQHATTRNALSSTNDRISALEEQIGQLRIEKNAVESTAKGLEQQNDRLDAEVG
jgi:chromosome segregation ATPase